MSSTVVYTKPMSVTNYDPPLNETITRISIVTNVTRLDGDFVAYDASVTELVSGTSWARQISEFYTPSKELLKEFILS